MPDSVDFTVFQTASDVFGVPVAELSHASSPATIDGWDSVQHLNFVLALEQTAGIEILPEDVEQMQTLGDAIRVIRQKKGG